MGFLPPISNTHYRGAFWASLVLAFLALHTLAAGAAKLLLPDSGLISLAGLNLAHEGGLQMIALAAWGGATQFVWGVVLMLIVLRHRNLTAPFALMVALEKALIIFSSAVKPTNATPMVPGGTLTMVLLAAAVLAFFGGRAKSN
jgi:hypothetical protein